MYCTNIEHVHEYNLLEYIFFLRKPSAKRERRQQEGSDVSSSTAITIL